VSESACNCDDSLELRAEVERLKADMRRMQQRAPVITDDPYFYEVANAIDDHLGWATQEDEDNGLYANRIREVADELKRLRAERDYLAGMASAEDLRVMRKELAKEFEADMGYLPEAERVDFDEVIPNG